MYQLIIWQWLHMALEEILKHLGWHIKPCAICQPSFISQHAPCHTLSCSGVKCLAVPWRNHSDSHLLPLSIFPTPYPKPRAAAPAYRVISGATLLEKLCWLTFSLLQVPSAPVPYSPPLGQRIHWVVSGLKVILNGAAVNFLAYVLWVHS